MTIHNTLVQLTNQCVMCGLCIPHCPTYQLFQTESESPRGRIALFKALAEGQLAITAGMTESLDHCLSCQACEKMCPSQVEYRRIQLLGRELLANYNSNHQPFNQKLVEKMLETSALHPFVKLAAKTVSPLQGLLATSSTLSAISRFGQEIVADTSVTLNNDTPATDTADQVILFKGCSGDLFDQQVLSDSALLLNAAGLHVSIAEGQQCCGAMRLRNGDIHGMIAQMQQTIDSFGPTLAQSRAVLSVNNSCTGQLKDYDQLFEYYDNRADISADTSTPDARRTLEGAREIALKSSDIIAFLDKILDSDKLRFRPLEQEVLVHISCSLKNVLKEEALLLSLLSKIPGIRLNQLNDQFCCGAAGSYMLRFPDVANRLLDDKIKDIMQHNCTIIVSSNLGCSLHFKQGLEKRGQAVEVIHPVRLLARQLITED